jgi:CheY-like chemotaxis protein
MSASRPYILMLEDDSDDRYITSNLFREMNYNVDLKFFVEPQDVVPYMKQCLTEGLRLPSLALLDLNIPSGSGLDVLRDIKAHPILQRMPVVMISGSAYPRDVEESYRLGASSYIIKPLNSAHTQQKIDTFVRYWFETVELPQAPVYALPGNG